MLSSPAIWKPPVRKNCVYLILISFSIILWYITKYLENFTLSKGFNGPLNSIEKKMWEKQIYCKTISEGKEETKNNPCHAIHIFSLQGTVSYSRFNHKGAGVGGVECFLPDLSQPFQISWKYLKLFKICVKFLQDLIV